MKIPLIMRKQYQGQLSASMLYILLCYNVPIVMDSLVGSIESDMGIKAT